MAFADFDALKTALDARGQIVPFMFSTPATYRYVWLSAWGGMLPTAGATPTTAAACDRTTTGALGQQNGGSGRLSIIGHRLNAPELGCVLVCDRLSHQGGLSGTATGAQTTNLPTAALTRYTDGIGVWAALETYTGVGGSATTVTVSYTDQDGNAGATSPAVAYGGAVGGTARQFRVLPHAAGDYGVRSVESVTLAASTGTVGNFGVSLIKPLYLMVPDTTNPPQLSDFVTGAGGGGMPEVLDDACLMFLSQLVGAFYLVGWGSTYTVGELLLAEA